MPAKAPQSQVDFAKELERVRRTVATHQTEITKAAGNLSDLLEQTGCQAVLEEITGVKVHFESSGLHAGKFVTPPFTPADVEKDEPPAPLQAGLRLAANGIEFDETIPGTKPGNNETQAHFCFVIDPTEPDFFKRLENHLVTKKLEERGDTDERSALYREHKREAEDEAQKIIWRELPRGMER